MICLFTQFVYDDDLALTAKDRKYLQAQLNALDRFSRSLKMEMNMDKSKVMVMICLFTQFLYVDDLVLTAKDRKYLQAQLNALDRFSRSLKMEMNMDKSKVMVMQKQKSRATARKAHLGG